MTQSASYFSDFRAAEQPSGPPILASGSGALLTAILFVAMVIVVIASMSLGAFSVNGFQKPKPDISVDNSRHAGSLAYAMSDAPQICRSDSLWDENGKPL